MGVLIIAEAGVNHNGDLQTAIKLIEVAAKSGADLVKFQTFTADSLVTKSASKAEYQILNNFGNESQHSMLKRLELTSDMHEALLEKCAQCQIGFLSTGFDIKSLEYLHGLGQRLYKIPSGEITNLPYLKCIGRLNGQVLMSTGMANLGEIEAALNVIEAEGTSRNKVTLLHCTTEYPTPMIDVNLRAIENMRAAFGVRVGYSDHTQGIEISIAAVAVGATVIEKHFTLDRNLPGPDHRASIEPHELNSMIVAIRNVESALGDGIKRPSQGELKNMPIARKSLVAAKPINAGQKFTEDNISVKRPGYGVSPMLWDEVVGRIAQKDYAYDDLIEL